MTQTFIPYLTQLTQSIGWSLLHSLWQGALIWIILTAIFRAFPSMSARLKHGCALMALLLLGCWIVNTAITQWQQLQSVAVRISAAGATAYIVEVPAQKPGIANIPESAWLQISSWMPWLMLAYGLGLLIMLLRFGAALTQLHNLRRHTILPDGQMLQLLESLKLQMGIAQTVLLRLSTHVVVPIVIGALRPMILLPASMVEALRPEELEAILLHELAHISRADFLINVLQSCIETLLFFNPFVWWISACILREREHCCDDLVVAYTRQPLTYARVLAGLAQHQATPAIALAATGQRPLLLHRIKRIIEMKNHPLRHGHIIAACCFAALLLTVSIVCFTPSFAQKGKQAKTQKPTEEQTGTGRVEQFVNLDSNGRQQAHDSIYKLPAWQQPKIQDAIMHGFKAAAAGQKFLEESQVGWNEIRTLNVDSVTNEALKTAEIAIRKIDWDALNGEVDSAMKKVAVVHWPAMRKELQTKLSQARIVVVDSQWKTRVRGDVALVQREVALAARNHKLESRRSLAEARQEMAQAERRMERAREEVAKAREELRRLRRELSVNSGNGEVIIVRPPAPPSSIGIPSPVASPSPHPASSPSAPPPAPAAPPAGSYRK